MSYDVAITRLPVAAVFDLKGAAPALSDWAGAAIPGLPQTATTRTEEEGITLAHIGPDHWLLRADISREATLEAALRPSDAPPEISIVRVSDSFTFFRITGPDAKEIMSVGCPLDLHAGQFPEDGASYTEFFGLKALVQRCDGGFDCAVDQSYADMIADYLARATA